ncbi:pentapeptide repeat-containing protein [Candidatus Nitrosopelagicus brevis]|nr:pentapeptide repeat-containing protein [Candidatus Nitrosopelagicus brevis]
MKLLLLLLIVIFSGSISNVNADNTPDWVKNTAGWWATDAISEIEFVNAIEFLVNAGIINVSTSNDGKTSTEGIPDWVKNTAGWWATDAISETEFVNAIEFLVNAGIINVKNDIISENIPDWLKNNSSWLKAKTSTNTNFENFDISYLTEKINTCENCTVSINQHGFRGSEFLEEKSSDIYRIFAVGGSTTHGASLVNDDETWPAFLQQIINQKNLEIEIQIINAGIMAATTEREFEMISKKIVKFDPDMIIMYDGWNDSYNLPLEQSLDNWKSVCKLGNKQNFETIIIIQPILGSGNRILTDQEIYLLNTSKDNNIENLNMLKKYSSNLKELDKHCTKTVNFENIFDYVFSPVYVDLGHTSSLGNKIIADNVFYLLQNILIKDEISDSLHEINYLEYASISKNGIFAPNVDFKNKNFSNMIIKNSIFDMSDFTSVNLSNVILSNSRLYSVNFQNANLIGADLSNSNLSYANLSGLDLSDTNLSETILIGADLSNTKLGDMNFEGRDLSYANLSGLDLSDTNLSETILIGADLSNTKLGDMNFEGRDLSYANLSGLDLSDTNLSETILIGADLSNTKLGDMNFEGRDLSYANLSGLDLSDTNLSETILIGADLSNTKLGDMNFEGRDFEETNLNYNDFSYKNLSKSNFKEASFYESNLENSNLSKSIFINVDLTEIKNKSLKGTDLTEAVFSYSNLSNIEFPITSYQTNFNYAKMNESDLSDRIISGAYFGNAKMRDVNFENTDFSSRMKTYTFENRLDILELGPLELKDKLSRFPVVAPVEISVVNADVIVNAKIYNNFHDADLRNAQFKNANLEYVDFTNANLEGANLEGANLKNTYMVNTNLEGANLEGANLEGANLSCINHEICN